MALSKSQMDTMRSLFQTVSQDDLNDIAEMYQLRRTWLNNQARKSFVVGESVQFKNSGRTMTGGLDVRALEKPRQIFSSARNSEESGSLTIVATALVETGSKMDELIFQEFKGTGNSEIILDRKVDELRLWPAINLASSGTRKEEDLVDPKILEKTSFLRRAMSPMKVIDAAESLLDRMAKTQSNKEFLDLIQTS